MTTGRKITNLPDDASLDGTEICVIVKNPTDPATKKTYKTTLARVAALAGAGPLVATLNGSVAGNAYVFQMSNTANYKWYRIVLKGWNDAGQVYNWPVVFATFANLLADTSPPSTLIPASITLAASGGVVNAIIDAVGA